MKMTFLLKTLSFSNGPFHYLYFSGSSAEGATYVLAMMGVGIWFVLEQENKWVNAY
jgi:hypothetical protein